MNKNVLKIPELLIKQTIQSGEFPEAIRKASDLVAIIMTQDWCPQWDYMQDWISLLNDREGLSIYLIIYNQEPYFQEFMNFKETVFNNLMVPYVRYYRDGALIRESNYVSKDLFLMNLGLQNK